MPRPPTNETAMSDQCAPAIPPDIPPGIPPGSPPGSPSASPGQTVMVGPGHASAEPERLGFITHPPTGTGLHITGPIEIGRGVACALRFRDDLFLSRRAALIEPSEAGPRVSPLDPGCPVWLRVRDPRRLRDGDELIVGSTKLVLSVAPAAESEEPRDGDPASGR